ncbi:P pilus assembly/Cpx signaling pathway, periplasmic inhibitor/zinc-resistance associated protein [Brunnivagina elsteri]|uniref:P pilus assembly/Cpx signaling pathway, periplasmic inhibitor/zinc-resistance associated protein n=1 Tax=Brunnivagina elsteri CCALA 953 TaxID=987040 RepID=A0A2A2TBU3_9CYAN|nr:P pilus assembly/Cpx signaling pathway, periplasmic inhibitor/zinc-resistance associated protein [Calothrix elsteri]PAX51182.1 P pilus assembly/Cpx signaling pathway, periplasmic inhibitor/zinc-resistance associated protein [Calothrix elsteri CCALA 953]
MNSRNLSIVASIFAFSLTAIPFAAKADVFTSHSNLDSNSQIVAQAQPEKKDRKANFEKFAQELGLTDDQKTKIAEIRANTRTEVDKILTPEQRQERQQRKAERQANPQNRQEGRRNRGFKANLTDAQKAEIKKIMQSSKGD